MCVGVVSVVLCARSLAAAHTHFPTAHTHTHTCTYPQPVQYLVAINALCTTSYTGSVEAVYSGHPWDPKKLAVIEK